MIKFLHLQYLKNIYKENDKQEPVEPGDASRISFGHRKLVCLLSVHQIQQKIYVMGTCALHFPIIKSIYLWNIKSKAFLLLKLALGQKKFEKYREITQELWSKELFFLCTAFLHYKTYPSVKFQVSSLNSFGIMLRTRQCRKTATICSPFREHKKLSFLS